MENGRGMLKMMTTPKHIVHHLRWDKESSLKVCSNADKYCRFQSFPNGKSFYELQTSKIFCISVNKVFLKKCY